MWSVVHSPALANTDKNVKDNNFGFKLKHSKIKSILYDQREKKIIFEQNLFKIKIPS